MKKGKMLFAGNFQYEFRESDMVKALQSLGWGVEKFSWDEIILDVERTYEQVIKNR